jgi:Protein of unknown function (DUF2510)
MEGIEREGSVPAGWHPDPTGRHERRYWDGAAWTDHVINGGTQSLDPVETQGTKQAAARSAKASERGTAMTKQPRELMHEALAQNLEPDEKLVWFSVVKQFRAPAVLRFLLSWSIVLPIGGPVVAMFLEANWYVGVTPERAIFGRIKRPFQPDPSGAVAVPRGDVTVHRIGRSGGELIVAGPKTGLPKKFRLIKGKNIDDLLALLQDVREGVPSG